MNLKPMNNQLLVELIDEKPHKSGILLLEARSEYIHSRVLKTSSQIKDCEVKNGDVIYTYAKAPRKIDVDGHIFYLIDYAHVLGVVDVQSN